MPNSTVEEALDLSRSTGFDRLPVIDAGGDAIGLVNVFDILLDKDKPPSLTRYLRRMVTVQETEPARRGGPTFARGAARIGRGC